MSSVEILDALHHAAHRAMATGLAWGVYSQGRFVVAAPVGKIDAQHLLEVCHP